MKHFKCVARGIETAAAMAQIDASPKLWRDFTARQEYAGSAHADTETIVLRGPPTLKNIFDNFEAFDHPAMEALGATRDLLRPVMALLHATGIGRVMVVRLKAGGEITPHVDEGAYARYFARFHLVLESNEACTFRCGDEHVNMATGEVWWFNHQIKHSVSNAGPDRTHAIFDLCAPGYTGALA